MTGIAAGGLTSHNACALSADALSQSSRTKARLPPAQSDSRVSADAPDLGDLRCLSAGNWLEFTERPITQSFKPKGVVKTDTFSKGNKLRTGL